MLVNDFTFPHNQQLSFSQTSAQTLPWTFTPPRMVVLALSRFYAASQNTLTGEDGLDQLHAMIEYVTLVYIWYGVLSETFTKLFVVIA